MILALAICVTGFFLSFLRELPESLPYAITLLTVTILYPIALMPTFRSNRADYEFRLLHWFPASMAALWFIMQLAAPFAWILDILHLGFFFLWSIALVALGLFFIGMFAAHVLRRSRMRIALLFAIFIPFAILAFGAEQSFWNRRMQAFVFPSDSTEAIRFVSRRVRRLSRLVYQPVSTTGAALQNASMSKTMSSIPSSQVSSSAIPAYTVLPPRSSRGLSSSSSSVQKPDRLPKSGPELILVLGLLLLAMYTTVLQKRTERRA